MMTIRYSTEFDTDDEVARRWMRALQEAGAVNTDG
jgi:hypothetical protein